MPGWRSQSKGSTCTRIEVYFDLDGPHTLTSGWVTMVRNFQFGNAPIALEDFAKVNGPAIIFPFI